MRHSSASTRVQIGIAGYRCYPQYKHEAQASETAGHWLTRLRFVLVLSLAYHLLGAWLLPVAAHAADKPTLAIHMISGAREYESEASIKILQRHLEKRYRVSITASWAHDGATELGGIEHLPKADLLVVFARRMKLSAEHMAIVRKHWESGKPVVGIRTASHAFSRDENEAFDRQVMGGNYQGHFGSEAVKVSTADKAADHPVLKGVGAIESKRLYKTGPLAKNAVLLQNGTLVSKMTTQAVTWVHQHKGGRTFYTSLGVPKDFENEDFLRMIVNAIFWTTASDAADYRAASFRESPPDRL